MGLHEVLISLKKYFIILSFVKQKRYYYSIFYKHTQGSTQNACHKNNIYMFYLHVYRHTDTQTNSHTDKQRNRQTDTWTHRQKETQTYRYSDTQTHIQTETHTHTHTH